MDSVSFSSEDGIFFPSVVRAPGSGLPMAFAGAVFSSGVGMGCAGAAAWATSVIGVDCAQAACPESIARADSSSSLWLFMVVSKWKTVTN
ncbi:hypothetical protein D3C71_1759640 [compost metagenome]